METKKGILDALEQLHHSEDYPFHMPGHKRNMTGSPLEKAYALDITEIDGFDNLHDPEGILKEAMERAARLYHTEKTFFLVNGSTCGILSAIFAAVPRNAKVLVSRNSHKAVYNAISLLNLEAVYLYPEIHEEWGIAKGITAAQVEKALEKEPEIVAVILTSPTYEGMISQCCEIAEVAHKAGVPLIVDEAHGAHFPFHERFPQSALEAGADLVIQSVHKTLPAFTQTALLHLQGNLVQLKDVERYLSTFQSSSPSYLLMGGIDACIRLVEKKEAGLWQEMFAGLDAFYKEVQGLKHIRVFRGEESRKDPGKLVISVKGTSYTGQELYERLLEEYHLQMEMAADTYVLAILTCMDKPEGFRRLAQALLEIDKSLEKREVLPRKETEGLISLETIGSALEKELEYLDLKEAAGKECGCFLNLYPPGIPLIVPGEVISEELVDTLIEYQKQGLKLQGLRGQKVAIAKSKTRKNF